MRKFNLSMSKNSSPDSVNIVARVYFDRGTHGFEEPYEPGRNVKDYVGYFVAKCNESNLTSSSQLLSLEVTRHNLDGSYMRDSRGNRLMTTIFFNEELGKRIFP